MVFCGLPLIGQKHPMNGAQFHLLRVDTTGGGLTGHKGFVDCGYRPRERAGRWLMLVACMGVSVSASAATCIGPPALEGRIHDHPSAEAYAAMGNWFAKNSQPECAVESFKSWLAIEPSSPKALDGLARALIAAGDYDAVIRRLPKAPRDESLILDLSLAYRKAEMFSESARVLTEGLKAYPYSDALTAALVSLEVHQSHFDAAQKLADELVQQKPNDFEAQRIRFRTLVISGDYFDAAPLGSKLLAQAPHDADLLNLVGFLEHKAGDNSAARKHLEEAVTLNPNDYNSRMNLGLALVQLNDAAGAKVQLEKAIELGVTESQVRFQLAKVLRTLGETEEAQKQLELFKQKLKEDADQSLAVLKATQAEEAIKDGDKSKAADLYREACAAEPEDARLAYRLSLVLNSLGDAAGERAALKQAVKADPKFVVAQYALGYLEFHAGENAAAEQQFRITVKAAPDNARAWLSLAATLASESRIQEAQDAVATALKLDPDNAGARELSNKLAEASGQH